jgi:hypothetical protein
VGTDLPPGLVVEKFLAQTAITTNAVRLDPANGKMYSIQHYVIKFVSDLQQVCGIC